MRDFLCPSCGQRLAFENSECLACHAHVAFDIESRGFQVIETDDSSLEPSFERCANAQIANCNWAVSSVQNETLCTSCLLTRTRPSSDDPIGLPEFAEAEAAKRRLVVELVELNLPILSRHKDPENGLCFDLLSSARDPVVTGHDRGVITLDLAESDDVHRERLRTSMDEPYRTLLGHFRHEIGHYYFEVLISDTVHLPEFIELFGDPELDYQAALDKHYADGAPSGWRGDFISSYATMHPAEDWAETFAHYLHIRDTIDTAAAFGFAPAGSTLDRLIPGLIGFEHLIEIWLPLTWAMNMINRSMGRPDLYPFVLPRPVLDKMHLVHKIVVGDSA
jgi:hypothetical protein